MLFIFSPFSLNFIERHESVNVDNTSHADWKGARNLIIRALLAVAMTRNGDAIQIQGNLFESVKYCTDNIFP
ncbi:MAG: hypothetical protein J7647_17420 [Cyanobacteria bacterium SBLK]|nr:hypothetical protein [Cyanobacteria bacterium SBLK]